MDPGKLDRLVVIKRYTTIGQDEFGADIKDWQTLATLRAAYNPVSDGEKFAAGEVGATLSARFIIRWSESWKDISALDRLVFEDREFDIVGAKEVTDEGRRQLIEITAASRSETPPA
jgi:SPP1 family predicted phage head-tail adaptor